MPCARKFLPLCPLFLDMFSIPCGGNSEGQMSKANLGSHSGIGYRVSGIGYRVRGRAI
jgi:hypothetical protein